MQLDPAARGAQVEQHIVDGELKQLLVHRKGSTRAFPPHHPLIPVDYQLTGQPVLIGGTMGACLPQLLSLWADRAGALAVCLLSTNWFMLHHGFACFPCPALRHEAVWWSGAWGLPVYVCHTTDKCIGNTVCKMPKRCNVQTPVLTLGLRAQARTRTC